MTVYCKFDYVQRFEELSFGGQKVTAPYADEYTVSAKTCSVTISGQTVQGLDEVIGCLIFDMEKQQDDGSWEKIDERYHNYGGYVWENIIYFNDVNDSGVYRFGRVGYAVLDAEGNEIFFLHLDVPTSIFNITITE